jgi:hypothetical protein
MRLVRLLLAASAVTGAVAMSTPAQALPCIPNNPVAFVCVVPDSDFRGVVGGFYESGPVGALGIVLVAEGCYYPGGQPRYYVYAYTDFTPTVDRTLPVGGVPCV